MNPIAVGRGTVAPWARRTCPCHWVARGDLRVLLDCGAGSLHRLAEFGVARHQGTHGLPTHFHPHHRGALPQLVYTLQNTTEPPPRDPSVLPRPPGGLER